jgi:hypothetical protein
LHHALDLWFEKMVKPQIQGEAQWWRFADDGVCAFRFKEDAERVYRELPKRLKKFGLEVAPEKTQILPFSRFHPGKERRFAFLGFEIYWEKDRKGLPRVKRRTARKKLRAACQRIKEWIQTNRHARGRGDKGDVTEIPHLSVALRRDRLPPCHAKRDWTHPGRCTT